MSKLIFTLLIVVLTGCGSDKASSTDENVVKVVSDNYGVAQSFTYTLIYNGCSTGTHTFNSQTALCSALKNHQLNNNCAENMRQQKYSDFSCTNYTGSW